MDKEQALQEFWSGFGLPAYDESSVPTGENSPALPYITYEVKTGAFESRVSVNASLWYKSYSWAEITKKKDEISRYIGQGILIDIDGGYMWVMRGGVFAQRMSDPDDTIRRYLLSIVIDYLIED